MNEPTPREIEEWIERQDLIAELDEYPTLDESDERREW